VKRLVAVSVSVLAMSLVPFVAHASPTSAQCIEANEHAIASRKKLALLDAQRDLATCADAACPADIASECARQLHDIVAAIPSITFVAKSDTGADLTDVRVEMDGRILADHLGATAVQVDPGEHTFVLTAKSGPSVTRKLLLREGEKDRNETVTFAVTPPMPFTPPATKHDGVWRATGAALAGVGLVSIVLGSIFGVVAITAYNDQVAACRNGCTGQLRLDAQADHDRAVWSSTASTIGFVAGGVLLVAGSVVFFAAPVVGTDRVALSIGGTF